MIYLPRLFRVGVALFLAALAPVALQAQTTIYDAIHGSTATGGFTPSGLSVTGGSTRMIADDIQTAPGSAGRSISQFSLSLGDTSGSPGSFNLQVNVGFWAANGTGGGPGTLLLQYSFSVSLTGGGSGIFTQTLPAGALIVPANGLFWVGASFMGTPDQAGNGQANGATFGLHDPPTSSGSTTRTYFETATGYFPSTSNPSGQLSTGPNTRNFGWRFQAAPVPEPSTVAMSLVGGAILLGAAWKRSSVRRRLATKRA